jgi:hypothetical protein
MFNINQTISIPRRWFSSQDLRAGTTIICDRYAFSGVAYSAAKGETEEFSVLWSTLDEGCSVFLKCDSPQFFFHFVIIWFRYFCKTNCTGIVFGRHVFGVFSMLSPWINVAQAWTFRGVKRQIGDFPVRMASSSYTSMKRLCGSANQLRIYGDFHVIYR